MSKKKEHSFKARVLNWLYCTQCGLVRLKNQATEQAIRKGCDCE